MKFQKIVFAGHKARSEKRAIKKQTNRQTNKQTKYLFFFSQVWWSHLLRNPKYNKLWKSKKENCTLVCSYFPGLIPVNFHSESSKEEFWMKKRLTVLQLFISQYVSNFIIILWVSKGKTILSSSLFLPAYKPEHSTVCSQQLMKEWQNIEFTTIQ